ncbi:MULTISPECIES: roadblock/LC7 domain-containing protein [Nocardia]|uniref:roadblock/LC7 domain-containing protein n=1 Tax=Nocardia TaxID=1817 RepID=UPI000D69C28C|nr:MULTISPECIES: roadblock/LC7 domain-containing protein [Nocardia]
MSEQPRRKEIRLTDPEAVGRLLTEVCTSVADADYVFITSRDGLVVASGNSVDTSEEDEVALRGSVLAAAAAGIGDHFAAMTSHGRSQSVLFEADRGSVGVFPLTSTLVLVVGGAESVSLGRLTAAARKIIATLHSPEN